MTKRARKWFAGVVTDLTDFFFFYRTIVATVLLLNVFAVSFLLVVEMVY